MERRIIRVLIIEDEKDVSLAILRILKKMLESLSLEGEFCRITKYEDASLKLESEKYDLISLDGILGNNQSTYPLVKKILDFNPEVIAFSLSSDYEQVQTALNFGLQFGFLKDFDYDLETGDYRIITANDLQKIKEVLENKINSNNLKS
ncbi:MAG: response regulator [Candidatus Falkowbacteria bacterium]